MKAQYTVERKKLLEFLKSARLHLDQIDDIMKMPDGFDRGKAIAKECNRFEFEFDSFLCFACHVDHTKLDTIRNKTFKLPEVKP